MTSRFWIVGAALVASPIAVWLVLSSTYDEDAEHTAALILIVSWSFLAAGLVALARSPGRFGALMCAVGLAVYLGALSDANASIPFTIGVIVGSLWIGILVHALVAFPTGRLPSRGAVVVVGAAYAVVTVGQLAVLLFDDLADECPDCPDNAVLITADDTAASVLDVAVGVIGAVVALAVVVELARRWRSASGPLRRALGPVVAMGGAAIAAIAVIYASFAIAPGVADVSSWLALALLAAFPFAFLAGLLRMRLARAAVGQLVVELGLAIDELREIARGIHPALLTDRGLGAALEALAGRTPLPVTVELGLGEARLPDAVEEAAYYVAAEALTNVVKYARASQTVVRVSREARRAVVEVVDDGSGGADPARGSGLRGLADRVEALDGRLDVLSPRGGGTRVRATFPLDGAQEPSPARLDTATR